MSSSSTIELEPAPPPVGWWPRLRERTAGIARGRLGPLLALGAYAVGVLARWGYVLGAHHPRNFVQTDAMPITALAEVLADRHGTQQFFHTIWPPGASAFYALTLIVDPTLGLAAVGQLVLSCLVPLLVGHAARIACGRRAGWIALAMSALHFGFIHYGGFFLAEQLFQFAVALAVWTSVAALYAPDRRWRLVGGAASGLAWGLAFTFRPNALPVALFAGACLAVRWLRRRRRPMLALLAGGALGLSFVVVPLAHRCTSVLGRFCPGASNFAMNVALGHAPDTAGLYFRPQSPLYATGPNTWFPPARLHHGYQGVAEVPASLYDTGRVLAWVARRFADDPVEFVVASFGNVLDLFGLQYWPDNYANLPARRATILKQLVLLLVLMPGLAGWAINLARMRRRVDVGDAQVLFTSLVAGLFLLAAASLGEARYRIPFDSVFVILAAWVLAGASSKPRTEASSGRTRVALASVGAALVVATSALVATAHPRLQLAARLSGAFVRHKVPSTLAGVEHLSQLGPPRAEHSRWDAPGNVVFRCTPGCPALKVDLDGLRHSAVVEVSADHNDRYEILFARGGSVVGRVAWGAFEGTPGLRVTRQPVPAEARAGGYDTLFVRPLYGDSQYSVGHIRLLQ